MHLSVKKSLNTSTTACYEQLTQGCKGRWGILEAILDHSFHLIEGKSCITMVGDLVNTSHVGGFQRSKNLLCPVSLVVLMASRCISAMTLSISGWSVFRNTSWEKDFRSTFSKNWAISSIEMRAFSHSFQLVRSPDKSETFFLSSPSLKLEEIIGP